MVSERGRLEWMIPTMVDKMDGVGMLQLGETRKIYGESQGKWRVIVHVPALSWNTLPANRCKLLE